MDRLAEQVVIWHNRHPLAKRITIYDVHTIGVVALPFMRSGPAAGHGGQGHAADPRGPIEPVLTDEISPESLAAAWDDESTVAANTNAAHLDALADQEIPPRKPASSGLKGLLERLAFWRRGSGANQYEAHGGQIWPAFSERFVAGLSPKTIARFAQKQGYSTQPGDATWPLRIVSMDDDLMSRGGASSGGAWPFELYLMSAAIDAGRSRSRVLIGRGGQQAQILGGRCLSGPRLAVVGLLTLSLMGFGTALLIPGLIVKKSSRSAAAEEVVMAASAASANGSTESSASASASAPASAASAATIDHAAAAASEAEGHADTAPSTAQATTATASAPALKALAAPALDLAASAAAQREAMAAAAAAAEAAKSSGGKPSAAEADAEAGIDKNAPRPDIRPLIVKPIPGRSARPLLAPPGASTAAGSEATEGDKAESNSGAASDKAGKALKPADKDKEKDKDSAAAKAGSKKAAAGKEPSPAEPSDGKNSAATPTGSAASKLEGPAAARVASMAKKPVVALVGPVSANKAEAEATLERMRTLVAPTQSGRSPMQAQVFQTPEGYRPALWPFASREEAQLINATLVARGMRTRAVDF
ncbi:hypothetical protein [Paucibacter sp. Y2R2-4]|uniref:hypothetical protein n=1 Tax=Paucibacter sp. Y2R2-4 TaxID=2893553 RepID=UPI0021E41C55|nr:hypothetical protein [Paucibacter sp. Y2R2-4]MCV2349693.1 hypothetical protein [Paucibacter sp. Y2R2-4]